MIIILQVIHLEGTAVLLIQLYEHHCKGLEKY